MFSLRFRGAYDSPIAQEFDSLISQFKAWLTVEHNDDGTHEVQSTGFDFVPFGYDLIPVGASMIWFGHTAPDRWIFALGQAVSRTTYADLFAMWGTIYGVGDGSTTFNVPNFQQRFPLGYQSSGSGIGTTGGTFNHTHTEGSHSHDIDPDGAQTTSSNGAHTHAQGAHSHTIAQVDTVVGGVGAAALGALVTQTGIANDAGTGSSGAHTHTVVDHDHGGTTGSAAGSATGSANPPYLIVNFIILAGV